MSFRRSINRAIDWFQPPPSLIDKLPGERSEVIRSCRLSTITGLLFSVMVAIMFLVRLSIEGIASTSLYALLVGSLVCLSLAFLVKYTARYHLSNIIALIGALVILPVRVLETGGFNSTVISWYLIICMIFFVIGSIKLGIIAYLAILFELCVIYFAINLGWVTTDFVPSDDIQFWVFCIGLSTGIGVVYFYERQRLSNIAALEEKNKIISSDNKLLAQNKLELEKTNLDKSTLLNVLSHDIANPLQVITGYSELLYAEESDNKKRNKISNIIKATKSIDEIIEHVRQVQKANLKITELQLEPVDIRECIEHASFVFKRKLQNKNLSLIINENSFSELKVLAEPVSLCSFVINNILSNAIKFSETGGRIEISAEKKDQLICIKIQDYGIGMKAEIIENLFNREKATSQRGTHGEEGTGLGMNVMLSYLSGYGGYARIESTPKENDSEVHGTTFYIYLKEG